MYQSESYFPFDFRSIVNHLYEKVVENGQSDQEEDETAKIEETHSNTKVHINDTTEMEIVSQESKYLNQESNDPTWTPNFDLDPDQSLEEDQIQNLDQDEYPESAEEVQEVIEDFGLNESVKLHNQWSDPETRGKF